MSKKGKRVSAFKIFYDEFVYKESSHISYLTIERNINNIRNLTLELRKTSKADFELYSTKLDRINKRIREQLNEIYKINSSLFEYCLLLYKASLENCNDKVEDMPFLISCAFYEDYRLDNKTPEELESSANVVPKYSSIEKKNIRNEAKGLTKFEFFLERLKSCESRYKRFLEKIKVVVNLKPKINESHHDFILRVEEKVNSIETMFPKLEKKAKFNDDYENINDYMEIAFKKSFVAWPNEIRNSIIEHFDTLYKKLKNSSEVRNCFNLANDISFETFKETIDSLIEEKAKYMKQFENGKFKPVEFLDDSYVSKFRETLVNSFFDERYLNKLNNNPTVDECVNRAIGLYDLAEDLGSQIFERVMFDSSHSEELKRNNDVRNAIVTKIYDLYNPVYLLAIFDKAREGFESILNNNDKKFIKEYNEKLAFKKLEYGYHGPLPTMKTIKTKIAERKKDFILEHCITELKSRDILGDYDTRNYDLSVFAKDIEINDLINLYERIKWKINGFDYDSLYFYGMDESIKENEKNIALKAAQEFITKAIYNKIITKHLSSEETKNSYRDICYNYFNENCIFIDDSNVDNEDELLNEFNKNRNKFNTCSKWKDFLNNNKLESNL